MGGRIIVDWDRCDVPPAMQDTQNNQPLIVLTEINPVLAEDAMQVSP